MDENLWGLPFVAHCNHHRDGPGAGRLVRRPIGGSRGIHPGASSKLPAAPDARALQRGAAGNGTRGPTASPNPRAGAGKDDAAAELECRHLDLHRSRGVERRPGRQQQQRRLLDNPNRRQWTRPFAGLWKRGHLRRHRKRRLQLTKSVWPGNPQVH